MKINLGQQTCFKLALSLILCLAGLQGCEHSMMNPETAEVIEDATGMIRIRANIDSSLYVIIPDFNPDTSFTLTGAYLPPDNLPDEFKQDGLRVNFSGETINVPPYVDPMHGTPLRLSSISKLK